MKLIVTGDWQLDAAPAHDRVDQATGRSTRFAENVDLIKRTLEAGLAAGADGMLHLGDLTEKKNPASVELEAAADLFNVVLKPGHRIWAVAGNHDGSLFDISSSSFSPLARMRTDAFKLFHQVEVDPELGMLAVPYIHRATPEEVKNLISSTGFTHTARFAAIHYGVAGCTVGPRNLVLQADYLGTDELPAQHLDHVFAGHIHKAQAFDLTTTCKAWLPGSPVVCDMGEREDRKTWILFDTVTREVVVNDIPQPRKWVSVPYTLELAAARNGGTPWGPNDIVKVTGSYEKPDYPKETLEKAFKEGMVRPFSLEIEVKQAKVERALRSMDITAEGGLRQALQGYAMEKYPNQSDKPGQMEPAVAQAMEVLKEQGAKVYAPKVDPVGISITDFLTFKDYTGPFKQGTPSLIVGKNGIGKTNFFEAVLWCLTGQTSKNLSLAGVVRQGAGEASVMLSLAAHGDDQAAVMYRITRSVKLSKAGKPTQKLALHRQDPDGSWASLSDGGVAEIQTIINGLIGGGFVSLRTTNFKFQNDASPFVRAHPSERKEVIGEVTGLEPLKRAFKVLEASRLESGRAFELGKSRLAGMVAAGEGQAERQANTEQALAGAQADQAAQEAALPVVKAAADQAKAADATARAKVVEAQAQVDALPNTQAQVLAAEQSLATFQRTYQASREAKARRFTELKAKITATEAKLKDLKAADPAEIEALGKQVDLATAAHAELEKKHKALVGTEAGARAEATAAEQALAGAKAAKEKAEAELTALGTVSTEDLGPAVSAEEDNLARVDALVQELAAKTVRLQAERSAATEAEKKLEAELAQLKGQDIGTCARCGQPIDSTHIEKELARLHGEIGEQRAKDAQAGQFLIETKERLARAAGDKGQVQAKLKALTERKQSLALLVQRCADLSATLKAADEQALKLSAEAVTKRATADALAKELLSQAVKVSEAKVQLDAQAQQLRAMREVGTQLGALTGQLAAERQALVEVETEGVREKAEAEAEITRLQGLLDKARTDHAVNDATLSALRAQVSEANQAAGAAASALVQALTAVNAVETARAAAGQRVADLVAVLEQIKAQAQGLETAKFELATLKERAEIDAAAAALLDPKQGLPVYLIDQALPFLEDRINTYMGLLGMDRLTVELSTLEEDKETLAVLVDNGRPGPKLDVAAFSGGQLDRVEYAIKCAMADLQRQSRGVTFGLVCFDEPTGGLDEAGKEGLIKLLYERCEAYPVSLVVSHDEALIRNFDHRLQFSQGPEEETVIS